MEIWLNLQISKGKNWWFSFIRKPIRQVTAEACNLNENIEYLTKQGFTILGISADPVKNQKKFHDKFGFKYDLLADENHEVCEKFGVWQLKKFMGKEFMGIVRTTFLFDENSVCTEVIEKVETKNHAAQILK